jgi:uncharacterized protein
MKVAITGATGFVGSRLVERLHGEQQEIIAWVRNPEKARQQFPAAQFPQVTIVPYTPLEKGSWQERVEGCEAVINLAGEPIADRWTPQKQKAILESRALGTQRIVEAINQAANPPKVLINASAVGYYGASETATFVEDNPPGNDFLSKVCQDWEAAAQVVTAPNCRVVILRTGIVLAYGGAIERMLLPFQLFAGGPIGSGSQWFSWIHREDLVNIICAALQQTAWQGIYNATAPNPVKMAEFCSTLGQVLSRPSWLPVPGFALELLLGEAAQVVLEGQRVLPQRLLAAGFQFQYPDLKPALEQFL